MNIHDFNALYHPLESYSLIVEHNTGNKYIKKIGHRFDIDVKALIRRRDFHTKIWNLAHENYFAIMEYIVPYKLAHILSKFFDKSVGSWNMFMYSKLFGSSHQDRSLLKYEIDDMLWAFYRITTFIIRRANRC